MAARVEMAGRRAGKLVVLHEAGRSPAGQITWACLCDCGNTSVVKGQHLRNGNTMSCGCEKYRGFKPYHAVVHGQSSGKRTRAYNSWAAMITRCENPNNRDWKLYGGRGVKVCESWRVSFEAFFADMGNPLTGLSLDRIDPYGNYEPGNCRWATAKEQRNNQRTVTKSM